VGGGGGLKTRSEATQLRKRVWDGNPNKHFTSGGKPLELLAI